MSWLYHAPRCSAEVRCLPALQTPQRSASCWRSTSSRWRGRTRATTAQWAAAVPTAVAAVTATSRLTRRRRRHCGGGSSSGIVTSGYASSLAAGWKQQQAAHVASPACMQRKTMRRRRPSCRRSRMRQNGRSRWGSARRPAQAPTLQHVSVAAASSASNLAWRQTEKAAGEAAGEAAGVAAGAVVAGAAGVAVAAAVVADDPPGFVH